MERTGGPNADVQLMAAVKMTSEQFLEILSRTPRDWRLEDGKIRRGPSPNPECPITAVAHVLERGATIPEVAIVPALRAVQLSSALVTQVVRASDDNEACDPLIRMQLMEACGLLVDEEESEVEEAGR